VHVLDESAQDPPSAVLAGDTVLGMISIRDIVDGIISDHEATIERLNRYIQA